MGSPQTVGREFRKQGMFMAPWPFTNLNVGDIVRKVLVGPRRGTFERIGQIKDRLAVTTASKSVRITKGVKRQIRSEGSKQLSSFTGRPGTSAKYEIQFSGQSAMMFRHENPFSLKHKTSKITLAQVIAKNDPNWNHARWIVVDRVYKAKKIFCILSEAKSSKVVLSGRSKDLQDFDRGKISAKFTSSKTRVAVIKSIGVSTYGFQGFRVSIRGKVRSVI